MAWTVEMQVTRLRLLPIQGIICREPLKEDVLSGGLEAKA